MPSAKPRIFYIDDDASARLVLTLLFGQQGYEVTAVGTSQAQPFISVGEQFDLYILGVQPLGEDSLALCQEIREVDRWVPIIIYTGMDYGADQQEALAVEVSAFVAKPYFDALLETVKAVIEV